MSTRKRGHQGDTWLRVFCPDDSCLAAEERLSVSSARETPSDHESVWLEVFCPEDRCEAETPTHIV